MNINLPATVFWGSPGVQGFDTSPHDDSRINDDQIRDFGGDPFQSTNEKKALLHLNPLLVATPFPPDE